MKYISWSYNNDYEDLDKSYKNLEIYDDWNSGWTQENFEKLCHGERSIDFVDGMKVYSDYYWLSGITYWWVSIPLNLYNASVKLYGEYETIDSINEKLWNFFK